jgi:hypothetical protein
MQHGATYINALYFVCVTLVRAPAGHSRDSRRTGGEGCAVLQTTLGYGDIVPLTRAELSFVIVLLCVAVTFVSFITATITSTVVRCAKRARFTRQELTVQPPHPAAPRSQDKESRAMQAKVRRRVVASCACRRKRLTERLLSPPRVQLTSLVALLQSRQKCARGVQGGWLVHTARGRYIDRRASVYAVRTLSREWKRAAALEAAVRLHGLALPRSQRADAWRAARQALTTLFKGVSASVRYRVMWEIHKVGVVAPRPCLCATAASVGARDTFTARSLASARAQRRDGSRPSCAEVDGQVPHVGALAARSPLYRRPWPAPRAQRGEAARASTHALAPASWRVVSLCVLRARRCYSTNRTTSSWSRTSPCGCVCSAGSAARPAAASLSCARPTHSTFSSSYLATATSTASCASSRVTCSEWCVCSRALAGGVKHLRPRPWR